MINEDIKTDSDSNEPAGKQAQLFVVPDPALAAKASSMQELLASGVQVSALQVGDLVEGEVFSVGKHEIYVNIPGYGIGVVHGRELYEGGSWGGAQPGDTISAAVLEAENPEGLVELSFKKAGHDKSWGQLKTLLESKEVVPTKIVGANKGGLMVNVAGVNGFLPVSQLTLEHYPRVEDGDKQKILQALQRYIGQSFSVQVITAIPEEDKLIVSEKTAFEQETEAKLSEIKIGDTVKGTITGVVDFGVFIRFGDLEGLAHISELAWQRIDHPKDQFQVGQEVTAKVIGLDKGRVSLSIKQMQQDPWLEATKDYTIGQIVSGKVTKLLPFGSFIELQKDVQGLAHIAELSHQAIKKPEEVLTVGETYEFKIIGIEPASHRIGLSRKAMQEKPAGENSPIENKETEVATEKTE